MEHHDSDGEIGEPLVHLSGLIPKPFLATSEGTVNQSNTAMGRPSAVEMRYPLTMSAKSSG
jgi:hypothetical protein